MVVGEELSCATTPSPIGKLSLLASGRGLVAIEFSARPPRQFQGQVVAFDPDQRHVRAGVAQLGEYFSGLRRKFDLSLDLRGTAFQVEVWKSLARIKFGETISYATEATLVGRPTAFRAVGSANGKNPLPIVLPCHRVVSSDGSLGGYSAGLAKKKWLLAHERDVLDRNARVRSPGSR